MSFAVLSVALEALEAICEQHQLKTWNVREFSVFHQPHRIVLAEVSVSAELPGMGTTSTKGGLCGADR